MNKKISLFSLVLLIVAAIDSIRNLPATAIFGSSLIFFFLLSAVIFLIPISLIAAEFTSRFSEKGGVFHWVRSAFGEKTALVAIWLQWINTMVWYPTILSFIAGTAAYLFDPALAQNKVFLVSVILTVFWGLTFLNLRGIHVSARINSVCGIVGLLIPMCFLILLGLIWIFLGKPVQIEFDVQNMLPTLAGSENWVSLVAIMASFLGMELAGVHVGDISNPQKNFPKAMGLSVIILLATMLFGALSIAVVIPENEIRLVDGIMQTFSQFFTAFNIPWFVPILTLLIITGSIGGMINWLLSPAKGLLQAAEHGFLPPFFCKKNRHDVPVRLLFIQGILVSLFCLVFTLMPSINAFYWFLTALSTELYMIMYVLLFASALKIGRPTEAFSYRIPRGTRRLACAMGLVGCIVTIIVGYFPPDSINAGSTVRYALLIACGNIVLISPAFFLCLYKKKTWLNKF
ncbi:MAG: amino acid permease [Chlamydiae bacterium CG10_big_fil_rev_8_21_14_0_10_42_34]|nr:MAG: amino acid permease [Chlamydiae bacterium CG10_big_fil_rev_8_21_14_0_10_42_34]